MPRPRRYSPFTQPTLSMTELVRTTLDHDQTDMLIDKWLEHRTSSDGACDPYYEWFRDVRERKHQHVHSENAEQRGNPNKQLILWSKGDFMPENVFCRTVDTGRLIPLDRTWTTHVYHHRTMQDRKLSMMPVVFTMLPELMLLRGMHDSGCDEIFIIVTDLKRQEMDDVTEYFKLVCRHAYGRTCKPSLESKIFYEHMRLSHLLIRNHRTPCFPQIDLTLRALLYEKSPPFLILFSHQPTSYSQILFTHASYVPDGDIFYDYPTGCPNPCCTQDCEMIRFPRGGVETASLLDVTRRRRDTRPGYRKRVRGVEMCNWIECPVVFTPVPTVTKANSDGGSEEAKSEISVSSSPQPIPKAEVVRISGKICSRCRLVKYCSPEHQKKDWEEHSRVCVKMQSE